MQSNDINENQDVTFTVRIKTVRNKDIDGRYQVTHYRNGIMFSNFWYRFSGILDSIDGTGEEFDIPENFKINVCIPHISESEHTQKITQNILPCVKVGTRVKCRGELRKLNKSGEPEVVGIEDIDDAYEIWVDDIEIIPWQKNERNEEVPRTPS